MNVYFHATVRHNIDSAVLNDDFHICDISDSDDHIYTTLRGSHQESQDTQVKTFNRLIVALAATKWLNQNLCHGIETKIKTLWISKRQTWKG